MKIASTQTLGEIVNQNFRAAGVFAKYKLDFCCGGKQTLAEACERKQLDVTAVSDDLGQIGESEDSSRDFQHMKPATLISYILLHHHFYIQQQMPVILQHIEKVAFKHGERFPYMVEVAKKFSLLQDELLMHMQKEERILFPGIQQLVISIEENGHPFPGAERLLMPMMVMEEEHELAGNLMETVHQLTGGYAVPEDACTTFRISLAELDEFEQKLHEHVHLENNLLFPTVRKMLHLEKA